MTWLDNFAYTQSLVSQGLYQRTAPSAFAPSSFRIPSNLGYDPFRRTAGGAAGDLTSSTLKPSSIAKPDTLLPTHVNAPNPYGTNAGVATQPGQKDLQPPGSTAGDWIKSAAATAQSMIGPTGINLGNAIPWVMERLTVNATELARELHKNQDPFSQAGAIALDNIHAATQPFLDGVAKVSDVVAPVIDGAVNLYRDARNESNAKVYQSLLTGKPLDPLTTFWLTGDLFLGAGGEGANQRYHALDDLRKTISAGTDPTKIEQAKFALDAMKELIDLPPSVKQTLAENPNMTVEQINKALDAAPEGRMWSYQPGATGVVANFGYPILGYVVLAIATKNIGGAALGATIGPEGIAAIRAGMTVSRGLKGAEAATAFARGAEGAGALGRLGQGVTLAIKLQSLALKSGMAVTALDTIGNYIARVGGNQAAVDWFDHVSSTSSDGFSANPHVQLVTSFTVNPFEALGALKKGVLKVRGGADIVLVRTIGAKYLRYVTHDDLMVETIRRMYQPEGATWTVAATRDWIGKWYEDGTAFNEVVYQAAQIVTSRLSDAERAVLNALPVVERTTAVMRTYGKEIVTVLEKEPDVIAAHFRQHAWEYHQYNGSFDPSVAAANARDFRVRMANTAALREQTGWVLAYNDRLPPVGEQIAREHIDAAVTAEGMVSRHDINQLIRKLPVMRRFWQEHLPPGKGDVPRELVDRMVNDAATDYLLQTKRNPIGVATGRDPTIRTDLPDIEGQYARSLGTTRETTDFYLNEVLTGKAKVDPAGDALLRDLLVQKDVLTPEAAAALSPEQLRHAADEYITRTTEPWLATGESIKTAQQELSKIQQRLAALRVRNSPGDRLEVATLEGQLGKIAQLVQAAGDPVVTFAERVANATFFDNVKARIARIVDPSKMSAADEKYLVEQIRNAPGEAHKAGLTLTSEGAPPPKGAYNVTRYTEPGSAVNLDKPHGLYTSIETPGVTSAHADLGAGTDYLANPKNPLDVSNKGAASAGVQALKEVAPAEARELIQLGGVKIGPDYVESRGTTAGKAAVVERLNQLDPSINWGRYHDAYEAIEAYGAVKARASGYDAIVNASAKMPEFSEFVVLDKTILKPRTTRPAVKNAQGEVLRGVALHDAATMIVNEAHPTEIRGAWDEQLAAAATRKVMAQRALDDLGGIEGQAAVLMPGGLPTFWRSLVSRRGSGWAWDGGATPVQSSIRNAFGKWLRDNRGTRGRMLADEVDQNHVGHADLWRMMTEPDNSAFVGSMSPYLQQMFRKADHGMALDEAASGFTRNAAGAGGGGTATTEAFVEQLGALKDAYEGVLADGGNNLHTLTRQAKMKVPDHYVRTAEGELNDVYSDPYGDYQFRQAAADVRTALKDPTTYSAIRTLAEKSDQLHARLTWAAEDAGITLDSLLKDPANRHIVNLVVEGVPEPSGAQVRAFTSVDDAIQAGNSTALEQLAQQQADLPVKPVAQPKPGDAPPEPVSPISPAEPAQVPASEAARVGANGGTIRRSSALRRDLSTLGVPFSDAVDGVAYQALLDTTRGKLGLDTISYIAQGVLGHRPATVHGLLDVLRSIENGHAGKIGVGVDMQAAAVEAIDNLVGATINHAKRSGFVPGTFRRGIDPALMAEEDFALARSLGEADAIHIDSLDDPMGSLQYGFAKGPTKSVALDIAAVPGLAEELLAKKFTPYEQRLGFARAGRVMDYVFGKHSNSAIKAHARQLFMERSAERGVDAKIAAGIWDHWEETVAKSRPQSIRDFKVGGKATTDVVRSDTGIYNSVSNMPNAYLEDAAITYLNEIKVSGAQRDLLLGPDRINLTDTLREATSFVRRHLYDGEVGFAGRSININNLGLPGRPLNLGERLATIYGYAHHNAFVTHGYYVFRFGMDIRYHAMNYMEAQILALGRAGFKGGAADRELFHGRPGFGMDEQYLRGTIDGSVNNTGFAVGRSRFARALRVMEKEQPDALRGALRDLQAHDPALWESAMKEMIAHDPELAQTIPLMGDNVDTFLSKMNDWYDKMLKSVTDEDVAATLDESLAGPMAADPAMAEVYGLLREANVNLWKDVRQTFFGNPDRSRAERLLNHYLLYWPISYQIKSAKWLTRVLFDRAGGIKTNAFGAYLLNDMASKHQQLLTTDPIYRDWYEKHKNLVYMAQMFLPITPDSMGVGLNPAVRSLLGEPRAFWDIGPIYTLKTLLPSVAKEEIVDLYKTFADVPYVNGIVAGAYTVITGREAPKAPVDSLGQGAP